MTQLRALLRAKRWVAAHRLASVRRESRLKVAFVSISAALLWLGAFTASRAGFAWLASFGAPVAGDGSVLTELVLARLLGAFALMLLAMLVVSNILVAFATFYRGREVAFLLQAPLPPATFFLGRFAECVAMSSWATAFLGSPVLLAYGLERGAPPAFLVALIAFYLPFVALPAAAGALLTIVGMRALAPFLSPARRGLAGAVATWLPKALLAAMVLATLVAVRATLVSPGLSGGEGGTTLETVARTFSRAQSPWLPSNWLTRGLLDAAAGRTGEALFHLSVLLANAALLVWLATLAAERWHYRGWAALAGAGGGRSERRSRGVLAWLDRPLALLPQPARALIAKDLRTFWRDPAQWSQFLLFFGVLVLYVANLRRSTAAFGQEPWRSWIALLNVAACLLVLATLTTRFVFPLISLEGKRFWVLGLAPLTRAQVLWQKFWLSVAGTSLFTLALASISAWQLRLEPLAFVLTVAGVAAATAALSGLAVGLGSLYPSFEEDNPARIVSGMGGTLNFLLSLLYVALLCAALTAVLHAPRLEPFLDPAPRRWLTVAAALFILATSLAATLVPMRLGLRNLERVEL